jgi:DinB superfamily
MSNGQLSTWRAVIIGGRRAVQSLLALGFCIFCHSALVAHGRKISAVSHSEQAADEGKLNADERAKVIKLLKDSQAETLEALEKLSDAQLKFKPAPERWSVLECAEHILLSEELLFSMVERAVGTKPNPDWEVKTKGKTEFLEDALAGRKGKAQAPEKIVPRGKLSREQVIKKFEEARAVTLKFAEETKVPLKAHTLDHPSPVFGTLNGYQWLIYIPNHNVRHNKQIAEVKEDAKFVATTARAPAFAAELVSAKLAALT